MADRLEAAGYLSVEVGPEPAAEPGVEYGGASEAVVKELVRLAADATSVPASAFRAEAVGSPTDPRVVLHLPSEALCEANPDCTRPPSPPAALFHGLVEVTVFSDSPEGEAVAEAIRAAGYRSVEMGEEPNDDLNIKYGAAPPAVVDEILAAVAEATGLSPEVFRRLDVFDQSDDDVFVNVGSAAILAARGGRSAPARPERLEPVRKVVVFTDSLDAAKRMSDRLREEGAGAVRVAPAPNPELNVKVPADSGALGATLRDVVADEFGVEPASVLVYDDADVPPREAFVNLPADRVPPPCGQTEGQADYRGLEVGATVRLRRHRSILGSDNWVADMNAYVGRTAEVRSLEGVDGAGCPIVKVDADGGAYYWRVRDLELVDGGEAI
mgnify:FL=1